MSGRSSPVWARWVPKWVPKASWVRADSTGAVRQLAGLVDSAEAVVVRLACDGSENWQGFVVDGEMFPLGEVPEGNSGPFEIEGDRIAMAEGHGDIRAACTWEMDGHELTLV